jgi:hypothetical protein
MAASLTDGQCAALLPPVATEANTYLNTSPAFQGHSVERLHSPRVIIIWKQSVKIAKATATIIAPRPRIAAQHAQH